MTSGRAGSFCHVFRHAGRWYAYDVGTSGLHEVDPVLARVLRWWGPLEEEALVTRLAPRYGTARVRRAVAEVATARVEEGLYRDVRPGTRFRCPICHDPDALASRLSHLTMTVTERCNLRCRYCLHTLDRPGVRPHRDRDLATGTALAALRWFAARCRDSERPTVSFYGGEPLLNLPLIRRVVREARARTDWPDLRFVIDTNGTLLDEATVAFVVAEGLHLQVSLDGPAAVHDRHRRTRDGRATHTRILAGIDRLLRSDPRAARRLSFVVTLAPPYDLPGLSAFFADFPPYRRAGIAEPPSVRVNFADFSGVAPERLWWGGREAAAGRRQLAAARRSYLAACAEGERGAAGPVATALFDGAVIRLHHRTRSPLPDMVTPTGCCLPGQRRLHLRVDGALQPCERVGDGLVIGRADSGIDLAAVDLLYRRMEEALDGRCRDCWALRLCDLCFSALARTGAGRGGEGRIPPRTCAGVRRRAEADLRLFVDLLGSGEKATAWLATTRLV